MGKYVIGIGLNLFDARGLVLNSEKFIGHKSKTILIYIFLFLLKNILKKSLNYLFILRMMLMLLLGQSIKRITKDIKI